MKDARELNVIQTMIVLTIIPVKILGKFKNNLFYA